MCHERVRAVGLALFVAGASACGDDGGPAELPCAEVDPEGCAPLYPPTYENVFDNTLMPICGTEGVSCHADPGAAGAESNGLVFRDPDEAHDLLLEDGELPYVIPGEPSCSLVVRRIEVDDSKQRMPPGATPLDARERCSIIQWIADGAMR